jgi:hypothetical protein
MGRFARGHDGPSFVALRLLMLIIFCIGVSKDIEKGVSVEEC